MALLRAVGRGAERRLLAAMLTGLLLSVSCAAPGVQPDPGPPAPEVDSAPSTRPTVPDLSRSQPSRTPTTSDHGDTVLRRRRHVRGESAGAPRPEPMTSLNPIKSATAAADFTMVNLEAALTTRGTPGPERAGNGGQPLPLPHRKGSSDGAANRPAWMRCPWPTIMASTSATRDCPTRCEPSRLAARCPSSASAATGPRRSPLTG